MLKTFIGITVFLVASILLLQIDDEQDANAQNFLKQDKVLPESKAFLYLLGIEADKKESPLEVGKELLRIIKDAENKYFSEGKPFDYSKYPKEKKLLLPYGKLFCASWNEGCIANRMLNKYDLDSIIKEHATLLNRYHMFLGMDDYHTLTKPSLHLVLPPYEYIAKGNRLVILKAISEAKKSNTGGATKILMKNISLLRSQLRQADTLISKLIYIMQISDNLDMLSVIVREADHSIDYSFDELSLDERNFDMVMMREYLFTYDVVRNYDKYPSAIGEEEWEWPKWVIRMGLKPNMSLNALYHKYKRVQDLARLEQKVFSKAVEDGEYIIPVTFYLRNYLGSILLDSTEDIYGSYVARLFDLNAKFVLINEVLRSGSKAVNLSNINNPYYENEIAYYSDDKKSICLRGPLNDTRNIRCLRINI